MNPRSNPGVFLWENLMIVIRTAEEMARALDSPLEPTLKQRLQTHWDRLSEWEDYEISELAVFLIAQPGDTLEQAEAAFGQPLVRDSRFCLLPEIVEQHGGWMECTMILSDDGYGLILLVQVDSKTDSRLLVACNNAGADIDGATSR